MFLVKKVKVAANNISCIKGLHVCWVKLEVCLVMPDDELKN